MPRYYSDILAESAGRLGIDIWPDNDPRWQDPRLDVVGRAKDGTPIRRGDAPLPVSRRRSEAAAVEAAILALLPTERTYAEIADMVGRKVARVGEIARKHGYIRSGPGKGGRPKVGTWA
jgi:hypothetical protein